MSPLLEVECLELGDLPRSGLLLLMQYSSSHTFEPLDLFSEVCTWFASLLVDIVVHLLQHLSSLVQLSIESLMQACHLVLVDFETLVELDERL